MGSSARGVLAGEGRLGIGWWGPGGSGSSPMRDYESTWRS